MSCKYRIDKFNSFVFVVTVYLCTFQASRSVSLGPRGESLTSHKVQESAAPRKERIKEDQDGQRGDRDLSEPTRGPRRRSNRPRRTELRSESSVFPAEPASFHSALNLHGRSSSTVGQVGTGSRSSASGSEDGYQADFTGKRLNAEGEK